MVNFSYHNPCKIVFGKDCALGISEHIKEYGDKVLVCYDDIVAKFDFFEKIISSIEKDGIKIIRHGGVTPNPKLSHCYEGIEICKKEEIELVLAIGGGSAIDTAKTIAAGALYDGDVWDFYDESGHEIENALPIGAVLTIPAAGSEYSLAAVVTKEEGNLKRTAYSTKIVPKFAILDPTYTYTLPKKLTAAGGFDIISHLLERYLTNTPNVDFTDRISEGAIKSMLKYIPLCLLEGDNYDYRAEVMWCGSNAQSGLFGTGREGDWASHDIAHELTAVYGISHGAALAVAFPAWMRYLYKENPVKIAQLGRRVFDITENDDIKAAEKTIEALEAFIKEIDLPLKLADYDAHDLGIIANKTLENRKTIGYYKKLSKDDVLNILEIAYK